MPGMNSIIAGMAAVKIYADPRQLAKDLKTAEGMTNAAVQRMARQRVALGGGSSLSLALGADLARAERLARASAERISSIPVAFGGRGMGAALAAQLALAEKRTAQTAAKMQASMAAAFSPRALVMGGGIMWALQATTRFDDKMRLLQATIRGTEDSLYRLRRAAIDTSSKNRLSLPEVAEGMVGLARMGFNEKEIKDAIKPVTDLAQATGTDLAQATLIAANVMRAFRKRSGDMTHIIDLLTVTANGSAQSLIDVGESMKHAASSGALLGESIEDVCAQLMMLANLGIRGEMAGTALRRIATQFADPKIQALLAQHGVQVIDPATRDLRRRVDVMKDIGKAMEKMGNADQLAFAAKVFEIRGMNAGAMLALRPGDTEAALEKLSKAAGAGAASSAETMKGLGGAMAELSNGVSALGDALSNALVGPAGGAMRSLGKFFVNLSAFVGDNKETISALAELAVTLLKVTMAVKGLQLAGRALSGFNGMVGGAYEGAMGWLRGPQIPVDMRGGAMAALGSLPPVAALAPLPRRGLPAAVMGAKQAAAATPSFRAPGAEGVALPGASGRGVPGELAPYQRLVSGAEAANAATAPARATLRAGAGEAMAALNAAQAESEAAHGALAGEIPLTADDVNKRASDAKAKAVKPKPEINATFEDMGGNDEAARWLREQGVVGSGLKMSRSSGDPEHLGDGEDYGYDNNQQDYGSDSASPKKKGGKGQAPTNYRPRTEEELLAAARRAVPAGATEEYWENEAKRLGYADADALSEAKNAAEKNLRAAEESNAKAKEEMAKAKADLDAAEKKFAKADLDFKQKSILKERYEAALRRVNDATMARTAAKTNYDAAQKAYDEFNAANPERTPMGDARAAYEQRMADLAAKRKATAQARNLAKRTFPDRPEFAQQLGGQWRELREQERLLRSQQAIIEERLRLESGEAAYDAARLRALQAQERVLREQLALIGNLNAAERGRAEARRGLQSAREARDFLARSGASMEERAAAGRDAQAATLEASRAGLMAQIARRRERMGEIALADPSAMGGAEWQKLNAETAALYQRLREANARVAAFAKAADPESMAASAEQARAAAVAGHEFARQRLQFARQGGASAAELRPLHEDLARAYYARETAGREAQIAQNRAAMQGMAYGGGDWAAAQAENKRLQGEIAALREREARVGQPRPAREEAPAETVARVREETAAARVADIKQARADADRARAEGMAAGTWTPRQQAMYESQQKGFGYAESAVGYSAQAARDRAAGNAAGAEAWGKQALDLEHAATLQDRVTAAAQEEARAVQDVKAARVAVQQAQAAGASEADVVKLKAIERQAAAQRVVAGHMARIAKLQAQHNDLAQRGLSTAAVAAKLRREEIALAEAQTRAEQATNQQLTLRGRILQGLKGAALSVGKAIAGMATGMVAAFALNAILEGVGALATKIWEAATATARLKKEMREYNEAWQERHREATREATEVIEKNDVPAMKRAMSQYEQRFKVLQEKVGAEAEAGKKPSDLSGEENREKRELLAEYLWMRKAMAAAQAAGSDPAAQYRAFNEQRLSARSQAIAEKQQPAAQEKYEAGEALKKAREEEQYWEDRVRKGEGDPQHITTSLAWAIDRRKKAEARLAKAEEDYANIMTEAKNWREEYDKFRKAEVGGNARGTAAEQGLTVLSVDELREKTQKLAGAALERRPSDNPYVKEMEEYAKAQKAADDAFNEYIKNITDALKQIALAQPKGIEEAHRLHEMQTRLKKLQEDANATYAANQKDAQATHDRKLRKLAKPEDKAKSFAESGLDAEAGHQAKVADVERQGKELSDWLREEIAARQEFIQRLKMQANVPPDVIKTAESELQKLARRVGEVSAAMERLKRAEDERYALERWQREQDRGGPDYYLENVVHKPIDELGKWSPYEDAEGKPRKRTGLMGVMLGPDAPLGAGNVPSGEEEEKPRTPEERRKEALKRLRGEGEEKAQGPRLMGVMLAGGNMTAGGRMTALAEMDGRASDLMAVRKEPEKTIPRGLDQQLAALRQQLQEATDATKREEIMAQISAKRRERFAAVADYRAAEVDAGGAIGQYARYQSAWRPVLSRLRNRGALAGQEKKQAIIARDDVVKKARDEKRDLSTDELKELRRLDDLIADYSDREERMKGWAAQLKGLVGNGMYGQQGGAGDFNATTAINRALLQSDADPKTKLLQEIREYTHHTSDYLNDMLRNKAVFLQ